MSNEDYGELKGDGLVHSESSPTDKSASSPLQCATPTRTTGPAATSGARASCSAPVDIALTSATRAKARSTLVTVITPIAPTTMIITTIAITMDTSDVIGATPGVMRASGTFTTMMDIAIGSGGDIEDTATRRRT
ncbi:hypothetical protein V8F20_006081 [Naviculisporaceae sp. PSN 640]